jgi:hypothetical protein
VGNHASMVYLTLIKENIIKFPVKTSVFSGLRVRSRLPSYFIGSSNV